MSGPQQPTPSAGDELNALRAQLARMEQELAIVYAALSDMAHDNERAAPFAARKTVAAFGRQWADLASGKFMLSDPAFKTDVDRIIMHEELLIDAVWFPGKRVLDAGCGGGRWSYGLAKLGAHVTAVDTNPSAIAATRAALAELGTPAEFMLTTLEHLDEKFAAESFDLVWSWGVLHHCTSFTKALSALGRIVKPGGLIHLYLYGRESVGMLDDLALFKERMHYNFEFREEERQRFLQKKAASHGLDIHHVHDIYAPLINRRFRFSEIEELLNKLGFSHVDRPIEHTELWITAVKGEDDKVLREFGRPKPRPPFWFERPN
jgi:2-polyprenyl-3-methyl-5-hydroxy-6-metoxy-1,4-benzoquinol methylase